MSIATADVRVPALDAPYAPRAIGGNITGRHIVSVEQFARGDLDDLFRRAANLRSRVRAGDKTVLKLCQRRIMATLAAFFVVFVNVARGLNQSHPTQLELMRSYAASSRQQFVKVRVPNSLPFLFTAIRIAAQLTVITAVVAEYFGGNRNGLGASITGFLSISKKDVGLAYVAGASILGLLFFGAAALLEHIAVPWQRQRSSR